MGKNQGYKAMQRSRVGSSSADQEEVEDGMSQVDGSFHSPEWHAAHLASLKTSYTITWEEYKKKQKEEEVRKGEVEADKDRMMREYRAQLDAERAHKLSKGKNHSSGKSSRKKENDRDSKKRSSKKRKMHYNFSHSERSSNSSSGSLSETSSSDDEDKESRRSRSRLKRRKKEKKQRSKSKHARDENEEADGPLPLSIFFGNVKS